MGPCLKESIRTYQKNRNEGGDKQYSGHAVPRRLVAGVQPLGFHLRASGSHSRFYTEVRAEF